MKIPVITASGSPYDIGYQHGKQAKQAIQENFQFYLNLWKYFSGVKREQILREAPKFVPYIEKSDPELMEELKGISEGSDMQMEEIIALNSRYEMNFAFMASVSNHTPEGCTAFALTSEATKNQHLLVGQNWDYKPGVKNSSIILRIKQVNKPNIIIHTEAGIIGQKGFNSEGIGICINFLVCDRDAFRPGLPTFIKVRSILNSKTLPDCLKVLMNFEGPNSVNMIIAHREGEVIDVECMPDDTSFLHPEQGILTHTNHFLSLAFRGRDLGKRLVPDTEIRNYRAFKFFQSKRGGLEYNTIMDVLKDHFGYPNSICRHRDERLHPNEHWETLTSMIINLTERKMFYTNGTPCSNEYETIVMDEIS